MIAVDTFPSDHELANLWRLAWAHEGAFAYGPILARSLCHVTARQDELLVGFVNVAWDGGIHAFLLDTTVHPDYRRLGLGTSLVTKAATEARQRGAQWLHVDYEAHLEGFYLGCGFAPTRAGLMRLTP